MPQSRKLTNEFDIIPAPKKRSTHVPATTQREQRRLRRQARQRQAVEAIQVVLPNQPQIAPPVTAGTVFTPNDGAEEKTTAMDRAKATVYRTHPMTIILAILATGLAIQFKLGAGLTLCIFAATAITGYWLFHTTDYRYSRAGLERHRIDQATALSQAQMQHEKELRELALNGIIKQLETRGDDY